MRSLLFVLGLWALPQSSVSQASDPNPADQVNLPYMARTNGGSSYSAPGQDVLVLSVPVWLTLRSFTPEQMGVRFRLTGVAGVTRFETLSDVDLSSIGTAALIPGIELLVPLRRYWTLRPQVGVGVGVATNEGTTAFLADLTLAAEFIFPWRKVYFGVVPGLRWDGTWNTDLDIKEGYFNTQVELEARYPLGLSLAQGSAYAGLYFQSGYFFNDLSFTSISGQGSPVDAQYEIGLSFGFYDPRPKLWFITLPRLSVGVRLGEGFSGLRIGIGGDWATQVAAP